uniref:coiled-coil domain-containing protein 1-like n=1 Tax=Fragaria vesca subsp. vesca TaxID=101020 RepID=UPI0005C94C88|nr:PREDICTED: coiled-coil domain-containing protein 1-like [Fragaria vesca subsp. vesca]
MWKLVDNGTIELSSHLCIFPYFFSVLSLLDRNGVEPSPIECWRKFYVSKAEDSKEEHWKSEKAKEIYEDLIERRDQIEDVFGEVDEVDEVDDWEIYEKVIREHSHGRSHGCALGLDAGAKLKDINSHNQTCNKPACLEAKENYETVKGEVDTLKDKLEKLTQVVQNLLPYSSDNSKSDNIIATDSSALHDDDGFYEDGIVRDGTDRDDDTYGDGVDDEDDDIDGYGADEDGTDGDGGDEDGVNGNAKFHEVFYSRT